MDAEKFEALVGELEATAARSPGVYRARVGAFALLGYVVYGLIIVAAFGLLAGVGALVIYKPSFWILKLGWKVGIPLVLFLVALIGALKVVVPAPQGLSVTRQTAPELFQMLDDLRRRLKVGPLEKVLLTDELNAGVIQIPRFGLFGSRSYLLIGVPLMQALSKEDLVSVIAHEFGHLSGNHSRFSGWVYRSVRSYVQVLERTGSNRFLEKFLGWYVPRLDAFSFPLRRKNEYEADAASAEIVGRERAGKALANLHVRASLEEKFWQDVKREARVTPHPPAHLFEDWARRVRAHRDLDAEKTLVLAMEEKTGTSDTHPSLKDRLAALSVEPRVEALPEQSAARALLGDQYDYYVQQAGYLWSSQVHEGWKAEHQRLVEARSRLAVLEGERQSRPLTPEEGFEYADLFEDVEPDQDSLPLYRAVLDLDPTHVGAKLAVARLLLSRKDAEGVPLMRSLEKEPDSELRLAASAFLSRYFAQAGDEEAAQASLARAQAALKEREAREQARQELRTSDRFVSHDLNDEVLEELRAKLEGFPVKRAYLVRKDIPDIDEPHFVLAFELTAKARMLDQCDKVSNGLLHDLSLPGETWVLPLDKNDAFLRPLKDVAGSLVFGQP